MLNTAAGALWFPISEGVLSLRHEFNFNLRLAHSRPKQWKRLDLRGVFGTLARVTSPLKRESPTSRSFSALLGLLRRRIEPCV